MAIARNNGQMPQKGTLAYYEKQSASARSSLFLVTVLTLVNVVLTIFANSGTMFLFSAIIPWTFAVVAVESMGVVLVIALVIAFVHLAGLLICALLWKKGLAASVIAAILYLLDCLFVGYAMIGLDSAGLLESLPMALFHILIMVYLIVGVINEAKAIKLRKEAAAIPFAAQEQAANQQGPEL